MATGTTSASCPLFPVLDLTTLGKDATEPQQDIQLGAPRTLVATSTIQLPDGYRVDPPDPIHVKTGFATFDKTYRFDGKQLIVERTVVILQSKLPKSDWKQYQAFTKDASLETENWIQLIPPQKKTAIVTAKVPPSDLPKPPSTATPSESGSLPPSVHIEKVPLTTDKVAVAPSSSDLAIPDNASRRRPDATRRRTHARRRSRAAPKKPSTRSKLRTPPRRISGAATASSPRMERNDDEAIADFRKELDGIPTTRASSVSSPTCRPAVRRLPRRSPDHAGLSRPAPEPAASPSISPRFSTPRTTTTPRSKPCRPPPPKIPTIATFVIQISNTFFRLNRNQRSRRRREKRHQWHRRSRAP